MHEKISWFLKALLLISSLTTLSFADGDNNNCFYTTQTFNMQDAMYIEEKIDYQGDIDWFKGNGPSQFTLHGVMVPPNNRDYDIEIYDYCGGPIVRSCTRGTGETENENCVTPTDAIHGDFYVKVYGFGGGYEANAPYYITAGVKATCDLESQPGYPLQNYFYRNQSLDSYGFYYRNPNSFSIGYYVVSNLFRPTGNFIDKAINNQIQLLSSGESTTFFDLFYPPSWNGNLWPEIGNYKHKTFLLAYCGLGYVDATSKNSFSYPLVCKADGEQCSAPGQNTGECCSGYCNTNSFCGQNAPQPNLQVTQIYTFPGNPTGGQPATVYVTTSETQGVNAPRSCTRLKIDGSDAAAFCQSIQAGNSTTGAIQVNLPVETHNITAIADFWGEVSESNEGDNWLSIDKYWKQPLFMNSQVENLRQRYYKNEAVQYDVYLTDQQTSAPLDGAYITTLNPFTRQPDWQNTSQQGRYWFDWNATETGLKQFNLNSFKYGYYQKNNYAQVIVTPETARLYASVFDPNNRPVWGAKFKIDGEDRGAAGRNGQIVIPSERGDRRVQVSCPNNNACYDQNIYLNGNTERRFTCNCPDSTTNIFLNLTAFSDALSPDDEHISANGLPIVGAAISIDGEFDAFKNVTDAGGFLEVKNIPYGYHDFNFYYCLNRQENDSKCNSIWHSYSRANVQAGTKYINFALNVDAMHAQGNQSGFESFTYKDGKWMMTAGKYRSSGWGVIARFLAIAAISFAVSYINQADLINRGCISEDSVGTVHFNDSRFDCWARNLATSAALSIVQISPQTGIPVTAGHMAAVASAKSVGRPVIRKIVMPIGQGIEKHVHVFDKFNLISKIRVSDGKLLAFEVEETIESAADVAKLRTSLVQDNKVGSTTLTQNLLGNRLDDARGRLREIITREIFRPPVNSLAENGLQGGFDYYVGSGSFHTPQAAYNRKLFSNTYRAGLEINGLYRNPQGQLRVTTLTEIDVPVIKIQNTPNGKFAHVFVVESKGFLIDSEATILLNPKRYVAYDILIDDVAFRENILPGRVRFTKIALFDKGQLRTGNQMAKQRLEDDGWKLLEHPETRDELNNILNVLGIR